MTGNGEWGIHPLDKSLGQNDGREQGRRRRKEEALYFQCEQVKVVSVSKKRKKKMKKKKKRNTVRKDEKPCFKLVVHLSRNSFGNLKLEIGTRMQSAAMRTDSERRSALEGQCTDILLFCYHIILFQATTRDVGRRRRRRARTAAEAAENKQTLLREKRLNMFYINLKCCRPAISVLYLPLKIDAPVCSTSGVCLPACLFCSSAPQLNVSVPILLITQVCLCGLSRGFKHRKNDVL